MKRRDTFMLAACVALALAPPFAQAQSTWPEKAVRVVLPYPPGGPSDIVMRLAADKMSSALKRPVIIENKPGAGGNLGASEVARAAPDGYTWLFGTDTLVTVNPHVYKKLGFKVEDLMPVTMATLFSQTLVCHPSLGVRTVAELVAKAKANKLSYASGGAGCDRRAGALWSAGRPHRAAACAQRQAGRAGGLGQRPLADIA